MTTPTPMEVTFTDYGVQLEELMLRILQCDDLDNRKVWVKAFNQIAAQHNRQQMEIPGITGRLEKSGSEEQQRLLKATDALREACKEVMPDQPPT